MEFNKLQQTIFGILNEEKKAKAQSKTELKTQADALLKKHKDTEEVEGGAEAEARDTTDASRIQTAINKDKAKHKAEKEEYKDDEKVEIGPNAKDIQAIRTGTDTDITGQEEYKKSQEREAEHAKKHEDSLTSGVPKAKGKQSASQKRTTEIRGILTKNRAATLAHADVSAENEAISNKIGRKNRDAALLKLRPVPAKFYTAQTELKASLTPEEKIVASGQRAIEQDNAREAKNKLKGIVRNKVEANTPKFSKFIVGELGSGIAKRAQEIKQEVEDEKRPKDHESKRIEALHGKEGYQTVHSASDASNWEKHPLVQGEEGSHGHALKQFIKQAIASHHENRKRAADFEQAKNEIQTRPVQSPSLQRAIGRMRKK